MNGRCSPARERHARQAAAPPPPDRLARALAPGARRAPGGRTPQPVPSAWLAARSPTAERSKPGGGREKERGWRQGITRSNAAARGGRQPRKADARGFFSYFCLPPPPKKIPPRPLLLTSIAQARAEVAGAARERSSPLIT